MAQTREQRIAYEVRNRERLNASMRQWRAGNLDHVRAYAVARRAKNVDRFREQEAGWRDRNKTTGTCPQHVSERPLRFKKVCARCTSSSLRRVSKYNGYAGASITEEQYESMLVTQLDACICGVAFSDTTQPNIDHCHSTGNIRGLLCELCNRGLGMARDSVAVLDRWREHLIASAAP